MTTKPKLKILAVPPNEGGCAYYRLIMPMQKLQQKCPDDVDIKFDDDPMGAALSEEERKAFTYDNMKWADVIFTCNIHKYGGQYNIALVNKSRELGKFFHFDTDDLLTDLYKGHRHYDTYKDNKLDEITKYVYTNSDLVSVTQAKFADRISQFVRNYLAIMKNAIDFELPCWNSPLIPKTKNRTRIGWVGGIHHEEDVKEIKNLMISLNAKVGIEKLNWGFYGRPYMDPKDPNRKTDWMQHVWDNYQNLLRGGSKRANIHVGYALPTHEYGVFYANMDISIAPLQSNAFNDSKSEIKLMECGRYGVPLVCTDVGCYNEVIKNGHNGYLVKPGNDSREWTRYMKRLIDDEPHRKECGENLRQFVNDNYDINKHIEQRLLIYRELISQKEKYLSTIKETAQKQNNET